MFIKINAYINNAYIFRIAESIEELYIKTFDDGSGKTGLEFGYKSNEGLSKARILATNNSEWIKYIFQYLKDG